MEQVKVKYDKQLGKYHIDYSRLKNQKAYRYDHIKILNDQYDLAICIETDLGAIVTIEAKEYARKMETILAAYHLDYGVRPIEGNKKMFLGVLSLGAKKKVDYALFFILPKGQLTEPMFDQIFMEVDLMIGYDFKVPMEKLLIEFEKGYLEDARDEDYFRENLYDSRIFNKFLATQEIA